MPGMDGIAATREIIVAAPDTRILILTTFEDDDYVFGALTAGASGFLLKRTQPEQLIAAIHTIAAGESLLSPSVTRTVINRMARQPQPDPRPAGACGSSPHASVTCSNSSPTACPTPKSPPPSSSKNQRSKPT